MGKNAHNCDPLMYPIYMLEIEKEHNGKSFLTIKIKCDGQRTCSVLGNAFQL